MIRAIRPQAMAQDDANLITGWNISPNVAYVVQLNPGSSACGVLLYNEAQTAIIASGAGLVGTDQPVILHPYAGQTIGMIDAELGLHLLLTTDGTEYPRTIRIGPAVDLPDEIHPIYGDDALAVVRATAGVDDHAHYIDDISVTCPLGFGAWIGDVASVPVDGDDLGGQAESITWTGTPSGASDAVVIRRHVAIAPAPWVDPVPVVPPVAVDDAAETDAATEASGNVLTNDTGSTLVVSAVNGLSVNVGEVVAGSDGGEFAIESDGAWTFDPAGDFASLAGEDTAETSVSYHISNGEAEASGTLTITVSAVAVAGDPLWADVALLIQAPETGATIADATGKTVTAQGNVAVSTALGYPTILFDGNGDRLDVGSAGDFNFMHNGTLPWTLDFIFRPTSMASWEPIFDTTRGTSGNAGVWLKFETSKKLTLGITLGYNNGQAAWLLFEKTFDHVFVESTEVHVALDFDITRSSGHGRMYVNGALNSSGDKLSYTPGTANHQLLMIGMYHTSYPAYAYDGRIRALRLTKGLRFASTPFTSPTWPLPTS